jgi:ferredoxin
MFSLDDACLDSGLCADYLPQFFELVDGKVRVRSEYGEPGAEQSVSEPPAPRRASI